MSFGLVLLIIVVVAVLAVILVYNRLVALRQITNQAWGDIDVQLKQRHDLVPNLVETVKGYAAHEKETLDAVVRARNAAMTAAGPHDTAAADNQVTGALRQLFALSEAYPDLKANQSFLQLQEELTATEGRVAYARQFYNDSVLAYNESIQKVPANVIAGRMGFRPREYFEADEAARTAPEVEF
jgi:LemA protein